MNIALILAGGIGNRTEQDIPKQFMNVYEKPLIIYTLENFERNKDVDAILVVCLDGWHEVLRAYAANYNITKLKWIISGGSDGQQSVSNGIRFLADKCKEDDIVLIHDAIRPYITDAIISGAIDSAVMYGSGLSAVRCQETIVRTDDGITGKINIPRTDIMRVQTPQAYRYGLVQKALERADREHITGEVYINTLMLRLGMELHFSEGTDKNVKITTVDDLEIFKSLLCMEREDWIK
ncbi:MAG: 2-C-methyl-D-erythritol 4-phosphate cytidylyltransferase [Lachnospiraceae bacterium]|nr:2-C-methyl-D-erythritol 4-phosphate cytidylyltransferase [Candidatus Colinaster equi]